jgi:Uma2 family endonuclease
VTTLLDVPAIRQLVSPLSVTDYLRLGEFNERGRRTELIRGLVIDKMSKPPLHYDTIEQLREILSAQIKPGFLLRQEGPLKLRDSVPEPDLAVVRGARRDFRAVHPSTAELVIEVAVSSLEIDRAKASIYAEAGVGEYWVICPEEKCVEVFRRAGSQAYAETIIVSAPAVLTTPVAQEMTLDLVALFA